MYSLLCISDIRKFSCRRVESNRVESRRIASHVLNFKYRTGYSYSCSQLNEVQPHPPVPHSYSTRLDSMRRVRPHVHVALTRCLFHSKCFGSLSTCLVVARLSFSFSAPKLLLLFLALRCSSGAELCSAQRKRTRASQPSAVRCVEALAHSTVQCTVLCRELYE